MQPVRFHFSLYQHRHTQKTEAPKDGNRPYYNIAKVECPPLSSPFVFLILALVTIFRQYLTRWAGVHTIRLFLVQWLAFSSGIMPCSPLIQKLLFPPGRPARYTDNCAKAGAVKEQMMPKAWECLRGLLKPLTEVPPIGIKERLMAMPKADRVAALQRIGRRAGLRWQMFALLVIGVSLPFLTVRLEHRIHLSRIFFVCVPIVWLVCVCLVLRLKKYYLGLAILEEFPNYCAGCGYDCQSSTECCPECGRPRVG